MKILTVVIPTYNRCETLKKAILGYQAQDDLQEFAEIIVVDDGSQDLTETVVQNLSADSPVPIRYFRQNNRGPAAARNVGIREAESPLILFTDDDIIPSTNLISEHIKWHRTYPADTAAVLGYVTWAQHLEPTPFMDWYGSEVLFSYRQLVGRSRAEYAYFYTCNLSVKSSFLREHGMFDEDFKTAAYEDIELGFRLHGAGLQLFFNSQAIAHHEQFVSFHDACTRYRKSLAAAVVFSRKDAGRPVAHLLQRASSKRQHFKRLLTPVLLPLRMAMDSRVPLPWILYRMMFRIYR